MKTKILRLGAIFGYLVCVVLLAGNLQAQRLTGTIIGRVLDQSGGVIPGARIVATSVDTGYRQESTTNESGFYSLPLLPNGVYSLEASMQGFQTLKQGAIALSAGQEIALDLTLSPGTVQQTIEVKAQAQLLQTQETAVKSKVYRDQVENLPLNSRSPYELGLLAPSTQVSKQGNGASLMYSINGQNAMGFKLMFDGVESGIGGDAQYWAGNTFNLSITSVDAIQEYDLVTQNYSADIKGSSGYVNFVSKSGTNKWHGSVYDFHRNAALDARNFFQANRGKLIQNDFGGTLSGPIKQDKVFFMVSYEGVRRHAALPVFLNVPTASFRATVDPRLMPFLDATPLPTEPIPGNANVGIYRANAADDIGQDLVTGRVDFNLSANDRIFVQYTFNDGRRLVDGFRGPGFIVNGPERHQSAVLGWGHSFSPTFLNDLKLGLNRFIQKSIQGSPGPIDLPTAPANVSVPGMTINTAGRLRAKKLGSTQPQLTEKAVWIKGRSTLTFGGNYIFLQTGQDDVSPLLMSFPTLARFAADSPSSLSSSFGTAFRPPGNHNSYHQVGLFVQEDFRATPSLTVNLGLRYDNFGVFSDSTGNQKNIIAGPFDPFRAPGEPMYNANHDFGPRVGLSWKPSSRRPFVLRSGFGVFYGTHVSGQMGNVLSLNSQKPFTVTTADYPDLSFPFSQAVFDNVNFIAPGRFVIDPDTKDLYTLQWNLTGEYQFGEATLLTIGYVGNHGVHVPGTQLPNLFDPLLGRRPNTSFGNVRLVANEDSMHYHGLQASLRRRLSNNLAFDAFYAWSHATGVETGNLEISAAVSFGADQIQTFKNRQLSRGNLPIDVTHNFSSSLVYQLPRLANSSGIVKNVFGGWTTSGILKTSTGLPFNLVTGQDTGDQTFTQRPNRVAGVPLTLSGVSPADGFVNRGAFTIPTAVDPVTGLKLGNMGNNSVRMPTTFTCDWMFGKRVFSTEKLNLDFRAEFFNILNHPEFALPVNNMASSAFGKSQVASLGANSAASDPRQIQFMLRLSF